MTGKVKPLVVQFDHGFMRPRILENNTRTFKKLGVDVISFRPDWTVVRKLMLESLKRKGDFCWHCHTGIFAYPMQLAVKFNVPFVVWGEPSAEYTSYYGYDEKEEVDERRFNRFVNLGITADDIRGHDSGAHRARPRAIAQRLQLAGVPSRHVSSRAVPLARSPLPAVSTGTPGLSSSSSPASATSGRGAVKLGPAAVRVELGVRGAVRRSAIADTPPSIATSAGKSNTPNHIRVGAMVQLRSGADIWSKVSEPAAVRKVAAWRGLRIGS